MEESRSTKLKKDGNPDLFTGEFWSGSRAKSLGLVDGIGDLKSIMKNKFGEKIKYVTIKPKKSFLKSIFSKSFYSKDLVGTKKIINDIITYMESKNIWGRYGF